LQASQAFHISPDQFIRGLSLGLPRALGDINPLATALAAFGIIGVGASELITYPYWCLEKGYAKFTGQRTEDDAWAERARGWMRVMHVDAFLSMIIYTTATLAFFLMGVAVLHNEGRDPDGMRMVSTLATAYVPVFGEYARWLFLIGAIAVLYSTFLVATAGNARMWTDGLKIYDFMDKNNQRSHDRAVTFFSMLLPVLSLASFCGGVNPVTAVLIAGFMQATLLPLIGIGALYLRHTRTDPRLKPSKAWDAALIISCIGLLMAGAWGAKEQIAKALGW
jgi:Mn2+/Fe2+ NRAMP family transporter